MFCIFPRTNNNPPHESCYCCWEQRRCLWITRQCSDIGICFEQKGVVYCDFIHKSITVCKDRYKEVLTHLQGAVSPMCPTWMAKCPNRCFCMTIPWHAGSKMPNLILIQVNVKSLHSPWRYMGVVGGSGSRGSLIFNLDSGWRWMVQFMLWPLCSCRNSPQFQEIFQMHVQRLLEESLKL
jgi:hypothetical protein